MLRGQRDVDSIATAVARPTFLLLCEAALDAFNSRLCGPGVLCGRVFVETGCRADELRWLQRGRFERGGFDLDFGRLERRQRIAIRRHGDGRRRIRR